MSNLFEQKSKTKPSIDYDASQIEVLEGLEPVRKRPGMYIGGTDENALHHLPVEIIDNSTDEAVAGFATKIHFMLSADNKITIADNGRGIPFDPHPKFPGKTALEVILTTLHSGGKFSNKAYQTAGGLHGVGISVVNALSDFFEVEVVRHGQRIVQRYEKGHKVFEETTEFGKPRVSGTSITFHPDPEIFGNEFYFRPKKLYALAKSKAYLFRGLEIKWQCDPAIALEVPAQENIKFPEGIVDYLKDYLGDASLVGGNYFSGLEKFYDSQNRPAKIEWALAWIAENEEAHIKSYCNTINTLQGGVHEQGFRQGLLKSLKSFADLTNNKKASQITNDDLASGIALVLSIFISEPQFLGQTKEKLLNHDISRAIEAAVKNHYDHYFGINKQQGTLVLEYLIQVAEDRINRKKARDVSRKTLTQKLRLPGKLADCARSSAQGTEIFIVEGDSAGGSAKQARRRETQAVLPLRGKILNVASNSRDKMLANQELNDLMTALGCGIGKNFDFEQLRYEKVIIMTDADVDGAHIASLLMTFFFLQMPEMVRRGSLYLAKPPLYRVVHGNKTYYAQDDKELEKLKKKLRGNIEVGRFKGLGEMTAPQLKETTMDPTTRILQKVTLLNEEEAKNSIETLMGKKPELRFRFIQEQTANLNNLKEELDI
ncbi:DNA topoisomerase IV subunit B [Rickettsiales endosymbiont of Stachyamoeba lipophora]|uniref:DNA topoisomerase IV subunit B n=1 Tax=Rickettsiales endosymbiont of Stachyamoeba lipophora TaxID=2486578 RepID=UPI000F64AFD4|nr:DNA topoisomerase IV subunit B [Rickettsiales endosymbiont of Stachyamoeba lipophora]AZL16053.1 DNA topoisomerase IV subunit B [Rickettsiales endosymbiont of Stachyamoeba lipophora]